MKNEPGLDLSAFMVIVMMLMGVLVTLLVAHTVLLSGRPENMVITHENLISPEMDWYGNGQEARFHSSDKKPSYIEVYSDRLVVYDATRDREDRELVVMLHGRQAEGKHLDELLDVLERKNDTDYVVLLAYPGSAHVLKHVKRAISDRGLDVGQELVEAKL